MVVTGIRASLTQSLDAKRAAEGVLDAISAEDVGKFPDKNLAEALQRVPGVQVNREFGEGERVSVRGTSPTLTRMLFNGHSLATADWFILDQLNTTRSFNYLMFPADIIGQAAVYKTSQADLEEGGIGGTIDVKTRNPLDLDELEISGSLQGVYTELADKTRPAGDRRWSHGRTPTRRWGCSRPPFTRSARSAATASRCWATSTRIRVRPSSTCRR